MVQRYLLALRRGGWVSATVRVCNTWIATYLIIVMIIILVILVLLIYLSVPTSFLRARLSTAAAISLSSPVLWCCFRACLHFVRSAARPSQDIVSMGVPEVEVRMVEGMYEKTMFSNSGGGSRSIGGVWGQDWTEAGQRAQPPAVHLAVLDLICRKTVMKDAMKKLLCRRAGPGGEWHTGPTGDIGGVERAVYQTRAEN